MQISAIHSPKNIKILSPYFDTGLFDAANSFVIFETFSNIIVSVNDIDKYFEGAVLALNESNVYLSIFKNHRSWRVQESNRILKFPYPKFFPYDGWIISEEEVIDTVLSSEGIETFIFNLDILRTK